MIQVSTPSQVPVVGLAPNTQGQPMLQLHRSNQSPFNRQFGMASGCSLMGAFVANLSGFSLAFGQVVWQRIRQRGMCS